ncbi:MAG: DNA/RNA non-specific endonuclease [Candidatus Limivicinus sp.]
MKKRFICPLTAVLLLLSVLPGCAAVKNTPAGPDATAAAVQPASGASVQKLRSEKHELPQKIDFSDDYDLPEIPEYSGEPYEVLNDNYPFFTLRDLTAESFENYAPLDELGRCGTAFACVGKDLMPTEERKSIGSVKPTGWQIAKYDFVEGKYLYNRCHLIGYLLTAENANKNNLITGTRYMNTTGMLPFELAVADYIKETENHVLYRVTPVFEKDNLIADGVLMEAWSVEDLGEGICYCIFVYNVQPGVEIDYRSGKSKLGPPATPKPSPTPTPEPEPESGSETEENEHKEPTYILNTKSRKFHSPDCPGADKISGENRKEYFGSREKLIDWDYEPCHICNP